MKYKVNVELVAYSYATVEVEAASADDALDEAREKACNEELDWSSDDFCGDIIASDAVEVQS